MICMYYSYTSLIFYLDFIGLSTLFVHFILFSSVTRWYWCQDPWQSTLVNDGLGLNSWRSWGPERSRMSDDKVEYKVVHGGRTLWWVEFATDCTISSLQVTGVPKKIDEEKEKGKQRERQTESKVGQAMQSRPPLAPQDRPSSAQDDVHAGSSGWARDAWHIPVGISLQLEGRPTQDGAWRKRGAGRGHAWTQLPIVRHGAVPATRWLLTRESACDVAPSNWRTQPLPLAEGPTRVARGDAHEGERRSCGAR